MSATFKPGDKVVIRGTVERLGDERFEVYVVRLSGGSYEWIRANSMQHDAPPPEREAVPEDARVGDVYAQDDSGRKWMVVKVYSDGTYKAESEGGGGLLNCPIGYHREGHHLITRAPAATPEPTAEPTAGEALFRFMRPQMPSWVNQSLEDAGWWQEAAQIAIDHHLAAHPAPAAPLPIILTCPSCGARHIDEGDFATKVHHTHACQGCGMVWRPAVPPTVGVAFLPGYKNATTEAKAERALVVERFLIKDKDDTRGGVYWGVSFASSLPDLSDSFDAAKDRDDKLATLRKLNPGNRFVPVRIRVTRKVPT